MLTNAIEITTIGKQVCTIELVNVAFSAVIPWFLSRQHHIALTRIKVPCFVWLIKSAARSDSMMNKDDFIDVGVYCAQICSSIERGTRGKTDGNLSPSFVEAITQSSLGSLSLSSQHFIWQIHICTDRTVNDIGASAGESSFRTIFSRAWSSDRDKENIAGWQQVLSRLLQVITGFSEILVISTKLHQKETSLKWQWVVSVSRHDVFIKSAICPDDHDELL
jgi:hypothetical protein